MNRLRSIRWIVGLPACLLLVAGIARAGFLSTRSALPNFQFVTDTIAYDLGPEALEPSGDDSDSLVSTSDPGGSGRDDRKDPLGGSLCLEQRPGGVGEMKRIDVALFGTLPPAASRSDTERLEDSLSALDTDTRDDPLAFLVDDRPTAGAIVGRMQSAGIYVEAAGVDLAVWIEGYKDGAPAQQLLALEDAVRAGMESSEALPMPVPGTPVLALVGLALLIRWEHRRARRETEVPRRSLPGTGIHS